MATQRSVASSGLTTQTTTARPGAVGDPHVGLNLPAGPAVPAPRVTEDDGFEPTIVRGRE